MKYTQLDQKKTQFELKNKINVNMKIDDQMLELRELKEMQLWLIMQNENISLKYEKQSIPMLYYLGLLYNNVSCYHNSLVQYLFCL